MTGKAAHFSVRPFAIRSSLSLWCALALMAGPLTGESSAQPQGSKKQFVVELRRKASAAQNDLGVSAVSAGNNEEGERCFKNSLTYDRDNLVAVFNLAGLYLNTKRLEDAIALLERYTERRKKNADLLVRLGDAYFGARQTDRARLTWERAFALASDYPQLPIKLATIYGLNQDLMNAERMLELAAGQTPNDSQLLNNLGNVYILNGKPDRAVEAAKQSLQVRTSKDGYLTLGTAYEATRDYKNSVISFERALDLGEERPEVLAKVDRLRKAAEAQG